MSADGNSGKTESKTDGKTDEPAGEPAVVRNALSNGAQPVVRDVSGNGAEPAVRDTPGVNGQSSAARAGEEPGGPDAEGDADEPVVVDPVSAPDAEGNARRTTRRFPLFTRDTARPEGGGRAAPRDAPAPARQWPILAVLALVGLGLLLTAFDVFRYGTILIGAALLMGGVLRWTLPDVGMLAVRSRFTDLVTYGVLGTAIVLLAMMAQPDPWLEIPFLDDTLHFTVR
ncbi:DUF3017 domain-containing protein [Streptomyces sp. NBC_01356]|uniref:DUF3017 domain-containing protein n=1 Tax=Streptomyces sp. NBC_01356 TaxID=2903836 RepID=UPI003FCC5170